MMPADPLLTIAQAAELLNVSKATVAWWVYRTRTLPHVSLGSGTRKLCRIRKSVLDDLIARGERPAFRVLQGGQRP